MSNHTIRTIGGYSTLLVVPGRKECKADRFIGFLYKTSLMVRNIRNKLFLIVILQLIILSGGYSQKVNYQEIFGDDWKKAELFEKENRIWMEPLLKKNNLSYPFAIAVIFPELVRYSALRDKMEITLLKALYINLGDYYANFSIGRFQMKPSFAESIRNMAPAIMTGKSPIKFKRPAEYDDIKEFRKSIVKDLEDPETQFNYLIAFIRICEKSYKLNKKSEVEKLKFIATAYNYGINRSAQEIEEMNDKKFFNTRLYKTENYCYADVAIFWYNQNIFKKE